MLSWCGHSRRYSRNWPSKRGPTRTSPRPSIPMCTVWMLMLIALSKPMSAAAQETLLDAQTRAMQAAVLGTWSGEIGNARIRLSLGEFMRFELGDGSGSYRVDGTTLTFVGDDGHETNYTATFSGRDVLTLAGGDLSQPLRFTRIRETTSALSSFVRLSAPEIRRKVLR